LEVAEVLAVEVEDTDQMAQVRMGLPIQVAVAAALGKPLPVVQELVVALAALVLLLFLYQPQVILEQQQAHQRLRQAVQIL
jgi:hypothetical protein